MSVCVCVCVCVQFPLYTRKHVRHPTHDYEDLTVAALRHQGQAPSSIVSVPRRQKLNR